MIKENLPGAFCLTLIFLINVLTNKAAIIQNPKLTHMDDGFLELKPNGSLILRGSLENSSNVWQEAILFKTILNAIRLMPLQTKNTLNQKIYGDGVEHKFPPFLERVIQRIQTYFSVYKYTDTSKPVRVENKPTTAAAIATTTPTSGIVNQTTLNLDNNEIDVNLTGATNSFNRYNKTTTVSSVNKVTKPIKITSTSATTTTKTTTIRPALIVVDDDADEENEFIEIKNNKLFNKKKT